MKKIILLIFLFQITSCFSQNSKNISYSDTIFELNQMKFEFKFPMSYRQRFKSIVFITNLTDSFKIISPSDIKVKSTEDYRSIEGSRLLVIPPKCTRKFNFLAEGSDFKTENLQLNIKNINTTGKIESVYLPGEFVLDKQTQKDLEEKIFKINTIGPIQLKLKDFNYKPNGKVIVKIAISYTNANFLGMYVKKIKLVSSNGKVYVNQKQKFSSLFYRNEKKEMAIALEFENPYGNSTEFNADRLTFEDVFVEYDINSDTQVKDIILRKFGEFRGDPNDEKEKDIEVIED